MDVQAAGTLKMRNGTIVQIDNASGHYLPTPEQSKAFLKAFQRAGICIDKVHLNIYSSQATIKIHITPNSFQRAFYQY